MPRAGDSHLTPNMCGDSLPIIVSEAKLFHHLDHHLGPCFAVFSKILIHHIGQDQFIVGVRRCAVLMLNDRTVRHHEVVHGLSPRMT